MIIQNYCIQNYNDVDLTNFNFDQVNLGNYKDIPNSTDKYYEFKNEDLLNRNYQEIYSFNVINDLIVDILIVGGGGGGGRKIGGGGGGGSLIYLENQFLSRGVYQFKVGRGGAGGSTSGTIGVNSVTVENKRAENGVDSEIFFNGNILHRAKGGGGGLGGNTAEGGYFPISGGSGGGTGGSVFGEAGLLSNLNIVNAQLVSVINNEYAEYTDATQTSTSSTKLNKY